MALASKVQVLTLALRVEALVLALALQFWPCLHHWLAVWLSGNALASINVVALRQTHAVSIWMGDRLWTGKPFQYLTSQLGRLSLLPSVGR